MKINLICRDQESLHNLMNALNTRTRTTPTKPDFRTFIIGGWKELKRFTVRKKTGPKLCPALSFIDDYLAARGQYLHHAIDIFSSIGAQIIAPTDGVMWPNVGLGDELKEWSYFTNGGWHCYLKGDDGFYYYFAHMRDRPLMRPGQRVKAGQVLGYVGRSGNTKGCPHCHFAMYRSKADGIKGRPYNPYSCLKATRPMARSTRIVEVVVGTGIGLAGLLGVVFLGMGGWMIWKKYKKT